MKVSATIRKTNDKNVARIYIRVRDENCDLRAATEFSINPKYWDPVRQGYKPKVALIRDEERQRLNNGIHDLCRVVAAEYYKGADSDWLKKMIFVFHHPNAYKLVDKVCQDMRLAFLVEEYIQSKDFDKKQACVVRGVVGKIERFQIYKRDIKGVKGYTMNVDTITRHDLEEFYHYLVKEKDIAKQHPKIYKPYGKMPLQQRSDNTLNTVFCKLRTVVNWCIEKGITTNNPFKGFEIPQEMYGTPYFITVEERNKVADLDLSAEPALERFRDMFIFQCLVGCRYGDLIRLTPANVIEGVLEYIPHKTMHRRADVVRVPLNPMALAIYEKFKDRPTKSLFPIYPINLYNDGIRESLTRAGVTRMVTVINSLTKREEQHPINEIASSHMARRTFVGNLYKQVKDPNLIASMSGHVNGSRAFARYRTIDDDMKKELIDLIQ